MEIHKSLAAACLLFFAAGCAELTAERPLFSVADQTGPPPLSEGIWVTISEECPRPNLRQRRFPADCVPMDIRREVDGAWRVAIRVDLISDLARARRAEEETDPQNGPYRMILTPAVERQITDSYAPLYVGELTTSGDETPGEVGYAVVAPRGAMPATEVYISAIIGCSIILRDGPVEGVTPEYTPRTDDQGVTHQQLTGCTATSQAAVREAARRTIIEELDAITSRRTVFVRAN
jgi:hypothetical protein